MSNCKTVLLLLLLLMEGVVAQAKRVAVIGGGIGGTFVTKYLVDYDKDCTLTSLTLFDPEATLGGTTDKSKSADTDLDDYWQGSRVASLELQDGTVVELGASIGYKGFHLLMDMIQKGNLTMESPFSDDDNDNDSHNDNNTRRGIGVYDGQGVWKSLTSQSSSFYTKLRMLYRYNLDLWRVSSAATQTAKAFYQIPTLLDSNHPATFFTSPDDIWKAVNVLKPVHSSFDQLLDAIGLSPKLPWWRQWLIPYQGSLREELLTAVNLVNYHQDNSQVNGIVGLASFMASTGGLFKIAGGNVKIISSAWEQAIQTHQKQCNKEQQQHPVIQHVTERVTTVVSNIRGGMSLYSNEKLLSEQDFDVVILAAPLQQSRITFLAESHMDEAVLHNMPLGMKIQDDDEQDENKKEDDDDELLHGHGTILPPPLPPSATRPYTQVVTTVVSNATLQADYFALSEEALPRAICFTSRGRRLENNITAISQLAWSETLGHIYKIFSAYVLANQTLTDLFGPHYQLEYIKVWGGRHGGATPDYQGQGHSMEFLLYQRAITEGGALYYVNAMEGALTCMEVSAMGAKAVAKLVAARLGMIAPSSQNEDKLGDEL